MLTDKEIIQKIKNGEINFFEIIVKKYLLNINKLVKAKISSNDDAEDIIQNVFIKFYKNINKFNENLPVLPYLSQIAKNEIKMYFRSKRPEISLNERFFFLSDNLQDKINNFFDLESLNFLKKHLKIEEQKMLLMLTEGFSYKEISQSFKKPLNTVKSIIKRARDKIKNLYRNEKSIS